jgi:ribosomal protein L37AE/L43A
MIISVKERIDLACPQCHVTLPVADNQFSVWCQACDWNVDPLAGAGTAPHKARDLAHHNRMFHRVLADGTGAVRPGIAWYGAIALAGAVNLATVALVVTGLWLLVTGT